MRLPKEFRFEGDKVFIKKSGSAVVLIPLVNSWDSLIGSLDEFVLPLEIANFDHEAARVYGQVRAALKKKARPLAHWT